MSLRYRICPDCGDMHDVNDWPAQHRFWNEALCAPSVISDGQAPTRSMANGVIYDSKSEMRKHYKRDGMVEVGNDPARLKPFKRAPIDRKGIHDAIHRAEARVARGDLTERMKQVELTRVGKKSPKHVKPDGPVIRSGTLKPSFA